MLITMRIASQRVTTGPGKSWKVLEFRKTIFQAWKVMENKHNVMDFSGIFTTAHKFCNAYYYLSCLVVLLRKGERLL